MNSEQLIKELAHWTKVADGELTVVVRGFEVKGVTLRTDASGREWIDLVSNDDGTCPVCGHGEGVHLRDAEKRSKQ